MASDQPFPREFNYLRSDLVVLGGVGAPLDRKIPDPPQPMQDVEDPSPQKTDAKMAIDTVPALDKEPVAASLITSNLHNPFTPPQQESVLPSVLPSVQSIPPPTPSPAPMDLSINPNPDPSTDPSQPQSPDSVTPQPSTSPVTESFSCLHSNFTGNSWAVPPVRLYDVTLIDAEDIDTEMETEDPSPSVEDVAKQIESMEVNQTVIRG
ncbi:hypothetical protein HDV00_012116 [Rhizophlyctis rosea]|nr:hypothetical protein HDV00_012116 [Rhizophlyctis rosea]